MPANSELLRRGDADARRSIFNKLRCAVFVFATVIAPTVMAQQHTLDEVASGLRSKDVDTRLRAIQILKDAGYVEAAAPLSFALSDPDERVKLAAMDAERSLFVSAQPARRKRVGLVIEMRTTAADSEAAFDEQLALKPVRVPPEVLSGLTDAMRSDDPRVRYEALRLFGTLAALGGPAASEAIRSGVWTAQGALKHGTREEQAAAATAIGLALRGCGTDITQECSDAGNALIDAINTRDAAPRRAAMTALGRLRYAGAVQALTDQLSYYETGADADAALESLASIGDATCVGVFTRLTANANPDVRRTAIEGLARSGSRDVLPILERLGDTDRSNGVLLALHFAAISLGAPVKPDQLVTALGTPALRLLALRYLVELSPAIANDLAASLQHPDAQIRAGVADALGFSHSPSVIPALEAAAKDRDAEAGRAAQRAIDRIRLGR